MSILTAGISGLPAPLLGVVALLFVQSRNRLIGRVHQQVDGAALLSGLCLGIASALVLLLWWESRTGIVFYDLIPECMTTSHVSLAAFVLAASIVNALFEETLWRHILFTIKWAGSGNRAVVLSFAFGLVHWNSLPGGLHGILATTIFALAAHHLVVAHRSGWWAAVLAHVIADVVALGLVSGLL